MASNIYLQFTPAIDGESTDSEHPKWIEISSFSHGVTMNVPFSAKSGSGLTAGKADFQDFHFTKYLDRTTPVINLSCVQGKHFDTVTVQVYRSTSDGGKPIKYMEYIMSNVVITNCSVSGSGGDLPMESISLGFNKFKWSYIPQKKEAPGGADVAIATAWDLTKNAKA